MFGKLGELLLREPSSGYSSNYAEAVFEVKKTSFNMFWEYSPSSANLVSVWLRAKRAFLRRELTYWLICGRRSLISWIQNDIAVS